MKVEIYADVVCPWCYIGERRFSRALAQFGGSTEVDVVFRSFQLDPSAPSAAVPLGEYLQRRFGVSAGGMLDRVGTIAESEGISIRWDIALSANTRPAHQLLKFAEREYGADVQRALVERLFAMYFTRGGNVADVEQLADEAAAVGIDRDRAVAYLASGEGLEELEADFSEARHRGIRAVPTFVIDGGHVIEGAQSAERFLEALEEVVAVRASAPTEPDVAACADGACEV